jgi:uncharacterized integral membrane protein (TIGR00698 family)
MLSRLRSLAPGIALSIVVALAGWGAERLETSLMGRAWVEALVMSILIGAAVRTAWTPSGRWEQGVAFSAKQVLEAAVVLLGLTLDIPLLMRSGPVLLAGIVVAVVAAIGGGYALGRALGLHRRLAILVACGNAICGNSAIAAIAPVIGAEPEDVASSIAFTAVLGVIVVLTLPLLIVPAGLSFYQYGVVAGLTVYAVPQVLAATLSVSAVSAQVGTLVKLTRVLMLGPIVLVLSILRRRREGKVGGSMAGARLSLGTLVPWFILGFLGLAALRATGIVPREILPAVAETAKLLTIVAMAALGLGVDVRVLGKVGGAVTATAGGSLLLLLAMSVTLVRLLGVG